YPLRSKLSSWRILQTRAAGGQEVPTSRHGSSTAIMIAVAMEEPKEAMLITTVLSPFLVMPPPILVGLGAALRGDKRKQGNGRRGGQHDGFCAHGMFLSGSYRRHCI